MSSGNEDYPRVTEILRAYTQYHNVPSNVLEKAAFRGTSVHAICAALAKGAWYTDNMINENYRGYVDSFKKWAKSQVDSYEVIEERMFDKDFKYTGQIDFVVKGTDGNLYLVDIKTSSKPQKYYPLQLAAYENLLRLANIKVNGCMLVYLNKDGEFPEIHFLDDVTEEFNVFQSALTCWHYFNKRKENGKRRKQVERLSKNAECDEGC